jgi:signal transduction histidine kinase
MLDRLESAFRTQRRFLDDVGHELRTPITVVRGHLDLMDPSDPGEVTGTVDLVSDELRRMSRLVDDLIVLARSEQPDFVVVAAVDVTSLLDDVFAKMSGMARRGWSLDAVAEGTVLLDRDRITQALLELATNAVRHTVEGDVVALGGARLRLWVRDSGPGISPDDVERVFGRFVRGSGERGSGLGLAIVAAVAHGHGGRVVVDSRPGEGATVVLDLPVAPGSEPAEPVAGPSPRAPLRRAR